MYLIFPDLLKPCRGDLTRTDDPLHPIQGLLTTIPLRLILVRLIGFPNKIIHHIIAFYLYDKSCTMLKICTHLLF